MKSEKQDIPTLATIALHKAEAASIEHYLHQHLRDYFDAHSESDPASGVYQRVMELMERPLICEVLRFTEGNQMHASRILGINRNTLRTKIKQLQINCNACIKGEKNPHEP